jgi:hypothetical protein
MARFLLFDRGVKPLLRISLFMGMLWLTYLTSLRYAFGFEDGYPLYPVILLGLCFSVYVRLRPPHAPRPVVYTSRDIDPLMIFVLAVLSCAYLLDQRGEKPYTVTWFLHLSVLTYFALLIPFIMGVASGRAKTVVATLTALILVAMFWRGTEVVQRRAKMSRDNPSFQNAASQREGYSGCRTMVLKSASA